MPAVYQRVGYGRVGLGGNSLDELIAAQILAGNTGDVSGLQAWDDANTADREARIAGMLADPNTAPQIRALITAPGYGMALFDYLHNNVGAATPAGVSDADRATFDERLNYVWSVAKPAAPSPASTEPARYLINGREVYADGTPVPGGYSAQADAQRQLAEQGYPDVRVTPDGRWYNIGDEPAQSYNDAHPKAAAGGDGTGLTDSLAPVNTLAAGMPLLLGLGLVGALIARGRRR